MVKKFSNAQEVNIFSSSNVSFYTILSHDSEILKIYIFFFQNLASCHHLKDYFQCFFWGDMPLDPPSVASFTDSAHHCYKKV